MAAVDVAEPFVLPPYPYDRLDEMSRVADAHPGGIVDCSIGTPVDAPPPAAVHALAVSGTERGYPSSAGGPGYRRAAADWVRRRFGVDLDPGDVAACVGTKEFVASSAHYLRLRDPAKDTVLYPAVSYPTYAMGAQLAGCRAVAVPPVEGAGGIDLGAVSPGDAARAVMLWVNSPANPDGSLTDLASVAQWGRAAGVPVFSDECYTEFTWDGPPRSILESGPAGVVAVHSISKRSNMAGVRAGFYAGDPQIVSYLRGIRQHAGLMVPGPVQAATAVALADDEHVAAQRDRYAERLRFLHAAFASWGFEGPLPSGGFYLWAPVGSRWLDAWALTADLASDGGLLVSPGDLYGPLGAGFVRVAAVQPMVRLRLAVDRLGAAGWGA